MYGRILYNVFDCRYSFVRKYMNTKTKSKFYYDCVIITQIEDIPWYVKLFGHKLVVLNSDSWEEGYLYDEYFYQFDWGDIYEEAN
jgi:hypothetical protein